MCTHRLLGDGLLCVLAAHAGSGHVYHSPGGDVGEEKPGGNQ
jgi:hypothetical protein